MTRLILMLVWTAICVAITFAPEAAMYLSWHLIQPQGDVMRVVVLGLFWFAGAGLCFGTAVIGFMLLMAGIASL